MSLAAWSFWPALIWPSAFWTPPRQVCSVAMLAPWRRACAVVVVSVELVVASWLMVVAIDACRAARRAVVIALA